MKMTVGEFFDMVDRGETPEQYEKRMRSIRRYANERDDLRDALSVLTEPGDAETRAKKEKRLAVVLGHLERLTR